MTTFNNKECIETTKGKCTTRRSKVKQVYCFKVRQEHKKFICGKNIQSSCFIAYIVKCIKHIFDKLSYLRENE